MTWTDRAACRGQIAVMFSEDAVDQDNARALCARCPVAIRCTLAAVRQHERFGLWGGFSPAQREALVKAAKRRAG